MNPRLTARRPDALTTLASSAPGQTPPAATGDNLRGFDAAVQLRHGSRRYAHKVQRNASDLRDVRSARSSTGPGSSRAFRVSCDLPF